MKWKSFHEIFYGSDMYLITEWSTYTWVLYQYSINWSCYEASNWWLWTINRVRLQRKRHFMLISNQSSFMTDMAPHNCVIGKAWWSSLQGPSVECSLDIMSLKTKPLRCLETSGINHPDPRRMKTSNVLLRKPKDLQNILSSAYIHEPHHGNLYSRYVTSFIYTR
jgi:hypothetical protein